jgi:hypothetical protein
MVFSAACVTPLSSRRSSLRLQRKSYRIQETSSGKVVLDRKAGVLAPVGTKGGYGLAPEEVEAYPASSPR